MARYWVGETGERGVPTADAPTVHSGPPVQGERERITDAVRRALAGDVQADDPD